MYLIFDSVEIVHPRIERTIKGKNCRTVVLFLLCFYFLIFYFFPLREKAKEEETKYEKKAIVPEEYSVEAEEIEECVKESISKIEPCSLRKSWTIMKDIEALLKVKEAETIDPETELGKAYLEELKAIQKRIYPRISDFH